MRRAVAGLLIVTWLGAIALAGPDEREGVSHDPAAAVDANRNSPWIDLSPPKVLAAAPPEGKTDHRLAAGLTLAGLYVGFASWAYLAWYRDHPEKPGQSLHDIVACGFDPSYKVPPTPDNPKPGGCDGWFGVNTYAGGADKLGHAWATMVLARGGTRLLDWGGFNHTRSAIVAAALSEGLFFAVEVKDYFYYEFSFGDFTMNTSGALAALAFELWPRLDELVDYRVQWFPSKQYRYNLLDPNSPCEMRRPGQASCSRFNVAEDYTGETYLLALHLGGIHSLRDWRYGKWAPYVDLSLGFASRNYKPPPTLLAGPNDDPVVRTQNLFVGISFNAQGLFDHLLSRKSTLRKTLHGITEVITPPLTIRTLDGERTTTHPGKDGA